MMRGGVQVNTNRPIIVGDHVWFGAKCTITKGAKIPDGCVIATNSCVYKAFKEANTIIGGYPAKVIRKNIRWEG